ncbi:MAG TPA: 2,3-bisphosphoglycerate-independent phosphoglycerate mutase, partial [Thermomicrobiales bacterium]|nr:2,3-bisphosphoglycerate-independent phosphoglycerate mutase [Thermomicrobiales bacterium]
MTSARQPIRPVVLIIMDGWGIGKEGPGNAILAARTPIMSNIWESSPHTTLLTSGAAVGLPEGQMGNSEVGHLNIGAGFVVHQWISRIDHAIASGEFETNPILQKAFATVRDRGSCLRIGALISNGGVHSHTRHVVALVEAAIRAGVRNLLIDAFTDGRDTAPTSGQGYVSELESELRRIGLGSIATVSGRY